MSAVEIILGALVILVSLAIIIAVLFQEGRRAGINGAISGAADTFLSKNKARTFDAFLARWTKYVAILFFILAISLTISPIRAIIRVDVHTIFWFEYIDVRNGNDV